MKTAAGLPAVRSAPASVARTAAPKQGRLDSLTGLRAVAALLVFLHHAVAYSAAAQTPLAAWLTRSGIAGVSFFFVLSGFVLAWASRPDDSTTAFWRRRAARILPMYWLAWAAGLVFVALPANPSNPWPTLPSLALVQSWVPDPAVYFAGNSPGWSLSCEALFYALFPALVVGLRRAPVRILWTVLAVSVLAVIVLPVILHPVQPTGFRFWGSYVLPLARLPEFVAGVAAALLVRAGVWPRIPLAPAVALGLVAALVANALPLFLVFSSITAVPIVLLLVAAAQRDLGPQRSLFSRRWFVKAGEWSYAFYLIHLTVIQLVVTANRAVLHLPSPSAAVIAFLSSALLAAAASELIEKPLERRLRPTRQRLHAGLDRPAPVSA